MIIPLLAIVLLRLEASSAAIESPKLSSSSTSLYRIRNADRVVEGTETPAGTVATIAGAPPGRRELLPKFSKIFASTYFGTDGLDFLSSMSLSASFSFTYAEPGSPLDPVTTDGEELLIRSDEATATTTSSSTITTIITDSTTPTTSFATTTSTTEKEEGSRLPPTVSTSVSTTYTPVVDEPTDEATVTNESYQKVGNSSDKRNLLPLISIAGGLVAISAMVAGYYRMKNTKSGIIHPDEKSIQSVATNESSDDLESSKTSSLASMVAMSTLANTSRPDRRVSI